MGEGKFESLTSLLKIFMVLKIGIKELEKELVLDYLLIFPAFTCPNLGSSNWTSQFDLVFKTMEILVDANWTMRLFEPIPKHNLLKWLEIEFDTFTIGFNLLCLKLQGLICFLKNYEGPFVWVDFREDEKKKGEEKMVFVSIWLESRENGKFGEV